MENVDNPPLEEEMKALREGIQKKYRTYHLLDRDRFPLFEFNTNRANYEPLRNSFEEEFHTFRGINRVNSSIHIPSTNTLARLFSEPNYVPSRKILNTCHSYMDGPSKSNTDRINGILKQTDQIMPSRSRIIPLIGLALLVCVATVSGVKWFRSSQPASGLVVARPSNGTTVPRELLAIGKVKNAETVWLVVHAKGGLKYWVQPPIDVVEDDTWMGGIYIGSDDKGDIGVKSQIRAFVNPATKLHEGDVLHAWPKAELSSEIIEVIRGSQRE